MTALTGELSSPAGSVTIRRHALNRNRGTADAIRHIPPRRPRAGHRRLRPLARRRRPGALGRGALRRDSRGVRRHRPGIRARSRVAPAGHDPQGLQLSEGAPLARGPGADRARGLHGHPLRRRRGPPALALRAAQRRRPGGGVGQQRRGAGHAAAARGGRRAVGGGKPGPLAQPDHTPSRRGPRRHARAPEAPALGAQPAGGDGLSRRLALCRQHGRAGAVSLPPGRHGHPGAATPRPPAAGGRVQQSLDPERGGERRRDEALRHGRLGDQRGHRGHRREGPEARGGPRARPRRPRHAGLRLGAPQPRGTGLGPRRHALDRGQRAGRPG